MEKRLHDQTNASTEIPAALAASPSRALGATLLNQWAIRKNEAFRDEFRAELRQVSSCYSLRGTWEVALV